MLCDGKPYKPLKLHVIISSTESESILFYKMTYIIAFVKMFLRASLDGETKKADERDKTHHKNHILHLYPNAEPELILWTPGGIILPGCLPLLVIERSLVDKLLQ